MVWIILSACIVTIVLMVFVYERDIRKLIAENQKAVAHNKKIVNTYLEVLTYSRKLLFDYNVAVKVLEDTFTEEKANEIFGKKKAELMKQNGGMDEYDGEFF